LPATANAMKTAAVVDMAITAALLRTF